MIFSLITVTYNSGKTLCDTMQSVLNQSYPHIEYIVVDGGSVDDTPEIIKVYETLFEGRMRWVSEKDSGLYDAMNKGITMATGEVIGIINSDDLLMDVTVIERVVACLKSDHTVDAVYGDLDYVACEDTSRVVRHWISGRQRPFAKGWHPAHPAFYVRREIYERCGVFDLDFKFAADFEWMLRLVERERIKLFYLPQTLVKMRLGGVTNKNLSNIVKGNAECIRAFKKNAILCPVLYPLYRLLPKIKQFF